MEGMALTKRSFQSFSNNLTVRRSRPPTAAAELRALGRDAQRPSPSFFQSGAEKIKMFKFKVKYTDKDGNPVEIEISVGMSSLSNAAAAAKIGISASKIISIKKL